VFNGPYEADDFLKSEKSGGVRKRGETFLGTPPNARLERGPRRQWRGGERMLILQGLKEQTRKKKPGRTNTWGPI